ncbi:MAG: response regulator [Paracoccaceae bacterium]
MPDTMTEFSLRPQPTPERPLAGVTMLVVEDSRFACEALRQLCLASGARLRRADCLASARRHLRLYRPDVVLVDLGLPDGPGEELIAELHRARPRIAAIMGISGDPSVAVAALAAGADDFLEKPIASLAAFQNSIAKSLGGPARPRLAKAGTPATPDAMALHDDLNQAARMLANRPDATGRSYLARFLTGVARSTDDSDLADAARALAETGGEGDERRARLEALVRARLATCGAEFAPPRQVESLSGRPVPVARAQA